jgi:CO dehydrogenase nickel-insertion accessory protein CooC1
MHVVFWSPVTGQTGATSSLAAIALTAVYRSKKKVLLTQSHFGNRELEEVLLGSNQTDEIYHNIGVDALIRLIRTQNLTDGAEAAQIMKDYIMNLGKGGLDLLCGTRNHYGVELEEELVKYLPFIYNRLKEEYDLVLTDSSSGNNRLSQSLWKEADILVVTLNQNITVIRNTLKEYQFPLGKTIFLLNNYQSSSAYNLRNLEKHYNEFKGRLYEIPHLTAFMDAVSDRDLINFYLKNMTLSKQGEREAFFQKVFKLTEVLLREKDRGGKGYVT